MKKIFGYVAGAIVAIAVIVFAATSMTSANSRKTTKSTTAAARITLCTNYKKNARDLTFKNGRKGTTVTLLNGKQQCVKKTTLKKNGTFTVKLTQKQAKTLSECATFKYSVAKKGTKTYTCSAKVYGKTTVKKTTKKDTSASSSSSNCNN